MSVIKMRLSELSEIPVDRQHLLYRGQRLVDDKKLSEYVSEDGQTIHLVQRPAQAQGPPAQSAPIEPRPQANPGAGIFGAAGPQVAQIDLGAILGGGAGGAGGPPGGLNLGAILGGLGAGGPRPGGAGPRPPGAPPGGLDFGAILGGL